MDGIQEMDMRDVMLEEQGTTDLREMMVISLNNSILFRNTKTSRLVKDVMLRKVREGMRHIPHHYLKEEP